MNAGTWFGTMTDAMKADVMIEATKALWVGVAKFLPALVGALFILLIGFIVAKLVQKAATVGLRIARLDLASERVGLQRVLGQAEIKLTASEIVGKIVYWVIILTFLIPAAETLGLQRVSSTIDALVGYLPNVIGAALIVVVGLVIASFIRDLVRASAESASFPYADAVARVAFGVVIVIVAVLAIGQLKLEAALLNRIVEILFISAGAALAIGFGLGSRETARNVVAGFFVRTKLKAGNSVQVTGIEGVLKGIGPVSAEVQATDGGTVFVPNVDLIENHVRVK